MAKNLFGNIEDSPTEGDPQASIVIYGYRTMGKSASSLSPCTNKVETFCRLAGLPYEVEIAKGAMKSPKKTVPYIQHGDVLLADSTFIVDYLTNTYADKIKVKPAATEELRGIAVACQRLCENHLSWAQIWWRWMSDKGWSYCSPHFFQGMPPPIKWVIPGKVRKDVQDSLYKQGLGRHSVKDINKQTLDSIQALSGILGNKKFITGDQPCPEDATVFATIDNLYTDAIEDSPLSGMIEKFPNLVSYWTTMKELCYPDDNPSKFSCKEES